VLLLLLLLHVLLLLLLTALHVQLASSVVCYMCGADLRA
jgi:hypothetical protein